MLVERDRLREQLLSAETELAKIPDREADLEALKDEILQLERRIAELHKSASWRLTKPLRAAAKLLRRRRSSTA